MSKLACVIVPCANKTDRFPNRTYLFLWMSLTYHLSHSGPILWKKARTQSQQLTKQLCPFVTQHWHESLWYWFPTLICLKLTGGTVVRQYGLLHDSIACKKKKKKDKTKQNTERRVFFIFLKADFWFAGNSLEALEALFWGGLAWKWAREEKP